MRSLCADRRPLIGRIEENGKCDGAVEALCPKPPRAGTRAIDACYGSECVAKPFWASCGASLSRRPPSWRNHDSFCGLGDPNVSPLNEMSGYCNTFGLKAGGQAAIRPLPLFTDVPEAAILLLHSITLSACASKEVGTVTPSALAVLRLITSSNSVGCSIGRSAGLAPFNILSTNVAALRNSTEISTP